MMVFRWTLALCFTLACMGMVAVAPTHACTVTPTPSPTPTPDANGYIPPTPTPYPTRTPVPLPTRVSQMATRSVVIVEGRVANADYYATPRYYEPVGTAEFEIERYYRGHGDGSLAFTYHVVPCPGAKPRFANFPQGVFFFTQDTTGQLYYSDNMPADDATRQQLALVVGPDRQPRAFSTFIVPMLVVIAMGAVAVWQFMLRNR